MDPHNEAVVTSLPHENYFYLDIYFSKQALLFCYEKVSGEHDTISASMTHKLFSYMYI